ncbi:hypothetical protein AC578_10846 [Pseudocercospora eumusae]|uniref:F-box domain-containing protein n=1 Tax=Pseudocercospora eumusae TaxID=321146 RepID=A0A139H8S5_9PEZI|nr:hypothetical protein AC578_10846 [Pseudocercospora eumusae]
MTMDKPGLTDLPPELLLEIVTYLSTSSLISLKLASRHLFSTTPSPSQDWFKAASDCEKTAWERAVNERKERAGGRRKCVHCGILAQLRRFPSNAPLCHWHQARFMSSTVPKFVDSSLKIRLLVLAREKQEPVWVRIRRTYCVHARAIVGWHIGSCGCGCNSCGHFEVACLIRIWSHLDAPNISELTRDGWYVSEEHWIPNKANWRGRIFPREVRGNQESLVAYRKLVPIIELPPR